MFGNPIGDIVSTLGITALVMAGQKVDLAAEPEEGEAGILASALDALEQAERRTVLAQKVAEEAAIHAAEKMEEMRKAGIGGEDSVLKNLKTALRAREKAVEAAKKVVREQRKSTEVARDLELRGILPKRGDE